VCRCSHSQAAFHSQCFQSGGESMAVEENFNPSMQQPRPLLLSG